MNFFKAHQDDLAQLTRQSRLRQLQGRRGADFASNDYLGLANAPRLRQAVIEAMERGVPVGAGGSRLLRGNHPEHERLEAEAAQFFGSESALYFSSGYAANSALLASLPQRGDLVIYDALVHASAHEGIRLCRAECRRARHNDMNDFAAILKDWRQAGGTGQPWFAVESLYSMDGDQAPLAELVALAEANDAVVLVDEAHATGVFGPDGRGLTAAYEGRQNIVTLRTCGKALGCEGALLCGSQVMRDFLINHGRGFIYSTAPSPLMAAAVRAALQVLVHEPERRTRLHALVTVAKHHLRPLGVLFHSSQILPLILGEDARTMTIAKHLQHSGFDVRGIRPPTVPVGTSRLRISLTLNVDEADIAALARSLASVL